MLEDDPARQKHFNWWNLQGHKVTIVSTVGEAISELEENKFDVLCLDHDLGQRTYVNSFSKAETGYLVALWLAENTERKPRIIVLHSLNPVGRENMKAVLPEAFIIPFVWTHRFEQIFKET